jgi:putative endonuclease
LKRSRYRVLHRNLRVGDDEADIVALAPDGRTVVVVEVKARAADHIPPEEQVGAVKQRRVARLAAHLQKRAEFSGRPFRFDVIAVVLPPDGDPIIRHHEGAFESPI